MENHYNIAYKLLKSLNTKYPNQFTISKIQCLVDSLNNEKQSEVYEFNKDKLNAVDKNSIICYSLIRNNNINKRINNLSEINIIGCSLFLKDMEIDDPTKIEFNDSRYMFANLFKSIKTINDLYEISKSQNDNEIVNYLKYLDLDKYVIRLYIDHLVLYYYLYTTNETHKKILEYIFTSPVVEIYYYISLLSGSYEINENKTCKIHHNNTFGTIMRLMPLFVQDPVKFKTYHSRDCRTPFGKINDLLFIKLFKDNLINKFYKNMRMFDNSINLYNEDIYAIPYHNTDSETQNNVFRYIAQLGCKKPIINSHGIQLLLNSDDLVEYLQIYPNPYRLTGELTDFSYGVDEISRIVKPIMIYIIRKINEQFDKNDNILNNINSLDQICYEPLYDPNNNPTYDNNSKEYRKKHNYNNTYIKDNSKCKYYYNNKGIIKNNDRIIDKTKNKNILNDIHILGSNHDKYIFFKNIHNINIYNLIENIYKFIINIYSSNNDSFENLNYYHEMINKKYIDIINNIIQYNMTPNIIYEDNDPSDLDVTDISNQKLLLYIIRHKMQLELIKYYKNNIENNIQYNNDDKIFYKNLYFTLLYTFNYMNMKNYSLSNYDTNFSYNNSLKDIYNDKIKNFKGNVYLIALYFTYCSLLDYKTRIHLLLFIYQLSNNVKLNFGEEYIINNIDELIINNVYDINKLLKFDKIIYSIHENILNDFKINDNNILHHLTNYLSLKKENIVSTVTRYNNTLLYNLTKYFISNNSLINKPMQKFDINYFKKDYLLYYLPFFVSYFDNFLMLYAYHNKFNLPSDKTILNNEFTDDNIKKIQDIIDFFVINKKLTHINNNVNTGYVNIGKN